MLGSSFEFARFRTLRLSALASLGSVAEHADTPTAPPASAAPLAPAAPLTGPSSHRPLGTPQRLAGAPWAILALTGLLATATIVEPSCAASTPRFAGVSLAGAALPAGYVPVSPQHLVEQEQRVLGEASAAPAASAPAAETAAPELPADAAPADSAPVESAPPDAAPADPAHPPFDQDVERWRPLVRDLLAEAHDQGQLDGAASRIDEDLVLAVMNQESGGDPQAESPAGALGLMQLMPPTYAEMVGENPFTADRLDPVVIQDARSNVQAGIRYLAQALEAQNGSLYWALASYNAGIGAVWSWRSSGFSAVPARGGYEETANYAPAILSSYAEHRLGGEPVEIPAPVVEPPVVVRAPAPPRYVAIRPVTPPKPAPKPIQNAPQTPATRRT